MARINGVNSDFKRIGDGVQPVRLETGGRVIVVDEEEVNVPDPLFMKLYICPYNEKSLLEAENDTCEGLNGSCPSPGTSNGHAMIEFHEDNGIELTTDDGNQLAIKQDGNILLQPTSSGAVEVRGKMVVKSSNGSQTVIDATTGQVTLRAGTGAEIVMNSNGQISIKGNITIDGGLTVNGTFVHNP